MHKFYMVSKRSYFFIGFFIGIFLMFSIFSFIIITSFKNGLTISIDMKDLSVPVSKKLQDVSAEELANVILEIKKNIPDITREILNSGKNEANLNISGFHIILPKAFVQEFESKISEIVEMALYKLIDTIDRENLVKGLSIKHQVIMEEFIRNELNNKRIDIELLERYSFPVKLNFR